MSQLVKLWMNVQNNPKTVSFEDANKLLTKAGFIVGNPEAVQVITSTKKTID